MFKVTLEHAIFHNHRLDSAYDGRYVVRLPDKTQVYAEDYERRLAEYRQRQGRVVTGADEPEAERPSSALRAR
jgi:hypothetical protein